MRQKVIAVANQKGGVGKTATTRILADVYAKKGKNVLLIDFDPQGSLTKGFDLDTTMFEGQHPSNIVNVFKKGKERAPVLPIDTESPTEALIHLIPSNRELGISSIEGVIGKDKLLKKYIDENIAPYGRYDVVIIDNNPKFDTMVMNSILASSVMVTPLITARDEQDGIKGFIDNTAELLEAYDHHLDTFLVLPTMYEEGKTVHKEYKDIIDKDIQPYIQGIKQFMRTKVIVHKSIPRMAAFQDAASYGVSAFAYLSDNPTAKKNIKREKREKVLETLEEIYTEIEEA